MVSGGINRFRIEPLQIGDRRGESRFELIDRRLGVLEARGLGAGKPRGAAAWLVTPYSTGGHTGSTEMKQSIDDICSAIEIFPDAFLLGHAHNYQRYTRRIAGKQVPYIVAGTGGISPQPLPEASGLPADNETTYDAALQSYGYLYVTASAKELKFEFWPLSNGGQSQLYDPFIVDLTTHLVTRG